MIYPDAGITFERATPIRPERVRWGAIELVVERIYPAILHQIGVKLSGLRGVKRVFFPALRVIDVVWRRNDVEIPNQDDRCFSSEEKLGMPPQLLEPCHFVIELGPGPRVAVGRIETGDENTADSHLEIAGLARIWVFRQSSPDFNRSPGAAENGHTEWVCGRAIHNGVTTTFPPNTLVAHERDGRTYDIDVSSLREGNSSNTPTYAVVTSRSHHAGSVGTLFLDGSVRSIGSMIDRSTWQALGTRAGAETPGDY